MNKKVCKIILGIIFLLVLLVIKPTMLYAKTIDSNATIEIGETVTVECGLNEPTGWKNSDNNVAEIKYSYTNKKKMIAGKEYKVVGNATVTGKKEGKTTITCVRNFNQKGEVGTQTKKIEITVIKSQEQKEEELKSEEQEATENLSDMKNAYKTIPSADAKANEIDTFIKSDAQYNNLNNLKTVNTEVAKKWKNTVESARVDTISRQLYMNTIEVLNKYIQGENTDYYKNQLANQMNQAVQATEETIKSIQRQIASITGGDSRNNVEFRDVFDDLNYYSDVGDISASDANKVTNKVSVVLTVITNVGMILAVLMCAIIGVKYMLGSLEEKAEYKKDMIPYLIGACLLFGITTIVKVLQQIGQSINNI